MIRRVICCVLLCAVLTTAAFADTIEVEGRDLPAIQSAIDGAAAGDTVLLSADEYQIDGAIVAKSGVGIRGAGRDETVVRFVGENPAVMLRINGCEDVTVSDLTLDGASNANCLLGIAGGNSRRITITRVGIRDLVPTESFGPHAIHFNGHNPSKERGVTDSEISDCLIENIGVGANFGGGIRLSWGSSGNAILRNTIRKTGRGGIFADNGSSDLVIRGNTVEQSGGLRLGIEIWGDCNHCVVEDNTIDHWLSVGGCDWFAVRNNTVSAKDGTFAGYGLEIIGSYGIVTGNLVDDGQSIGISVSGNREKRHVFYGRNIIRRCSQWGAQFQGNDTGIQRQYLYDCDFTGTTVERGRVPYEGHEGHGFRTNGGVTNLVFEDCRMAENAKLGLQLGGPDVDRLRFIGCEIVDNGGAAVSGPGEYTALQFEDCTVTGNATDALPDQKPFATPPPTAAIDAPDAVSCDAEVTLTSVSEPGDGEIDVAMWDLGDGPPVVGETVRHTYSQPGTYRVTLIVWDSAGRAARAEHTLQVRE